ncbi:MAG: extracellular solute-binding protein [Actinobacteria bacterium]|nr:extracellular solute-binding protein [Actinomycetota bacterium]
MLKKALIIIAVISLAVIGFASCKPAPVTETAAETAVETEAAETEAAESAAPVTLRLWTWQVGPAYKAQYDYVKAEFEKSHPGVTVEWEAMEYASYNETLKTAIAGGEAPDLFGSHPGPDTVQLLEAGQIADLTDKIKSDPEWSEWIAAALDYPDLYTEGKIAFAPQSVNHLAVWYYKDAYPGGFPETIDDLAKLAPDFKAKGIVPVVVGWTEPWSLIDTFIVYQYQGDPTAQEKENKFEPNAWKNPAAINAIETIGKLIETGIFPTDALQLSYSTTTLQMLVDHKAAAMWPLGEWYAASLPEADLKNDNIGWSPLPKMTPESSYIVTGGTAANLALNAKSANPDLALELLKFTNSPGAQEVLAKNLATPPGKAAYKSDIAIFNTLLEKQATEKILYRYIDDPDVNQKLGEVLTNYILGTLTAEQALDEVQKVADEKAAK